MYHRIFERTDLVREYGVTGVPRWERAALPPVLPLVRRADRPLPRRRRRHRGRVARARAGGVRRGRRSGCRDGRRYLVGDRFTAADLTFAALAAAVLIPSRYGVPLPPVEALPEPFAGEVRTLREHPAGAFALRLYDQERPYTQRR